MQETMEEETKDPKNLTLHGIRKMCEATDLASIKEQIVVQVVEVTIFTAENAKKNIKAKVVISDGFSKMICMLPDKVYNLMAAEGSGEIIRKFDIWKVNAAK